MDVGHERFLRIDAAFRAGDVAALRGALGNPAGFPNGPMPRDIGPCLIYAIYWSPLSFIEELLALGADPRADDGDGFPPLIAALCKTNPREGSLTRHDVIDVMTRLLDAGADPHQRGLNDWTALHMAVAERNVEAVRLLLARGADPGLRTRIDDCDTPLEMAQDWSRRYPAFHAALNEIAALLHAAGR